MFVYKTKHDVVGNSWKTISWFSRIYFGTLRVRIVFEELLSRILSFSSPLSSIFSLYIHNTILSVYTISWNPHNRRDSLAIAIIFSGFFTKIFVLTTFLYLYVKRWYVQKHKISWENGLVATRQCGNRPVCKYQERNVNELII